MAQNESQTRWIVLTNTIIDGVIPAYTDENNDPFLYEDEMTAKCEHLKDRIDTLQTQYNEFVLFIRDYDEIDINCDTWVEECELFDDGTIITINEHTFKCKHKN